MTLTAADKESTDNANPLFRYMPSSSNDVDVKYSIIIFSKATAVMSITGKLTALALGVQRLGKKPDQMIHRIDKIKN